MPKNLRIIKTSMRLPLKIISLRKPVADLQIENTNMNSILKYVWYENSKNSRCDLCAKIQTFERNFCHLNSKCPCEMNLVMNK